jgi:hypothetical protein
MKTKIITVAFATAALFFLNTVVAQENPLKTIPVKLAGLTNGNLAITSFNSSGKEITATGTITGSYKGTQLSPRTVTVPVTITNASCDTLDLQLGTTTMSLAGLSLEVGGQTVNMTSANIKDSQLKNALCSIGKLQDSNASPNATVAKLKQLIRAGI